MKLRPIQRADMQSAVSLLTEGFPSHSRAFWQESLAQMLSYAERCWDGTIGHIASANNQEIGICLSIPSTRTAFEVEPRKVVNLAGLYMRPDNEWMTSLFMRRIMPDPTIEYLDVTASATMRHVLRRLGFVDRAIGKIIVPTAIGAIRSARDIRILPSTQLKRDMISPGHRDLLEQHARLNAISLAVEIEGVHHPLILMPTSRRRLAGARIILARDRAFIVAIAGALSRYLLKRGIFFFEFDSPTPAAIAGARFVTTGAPVQTTWPVESVAIDHTFSELLFIAPPPESRPLFSLRQRRSSATFPFPLGLLDAGIAAPSAGLILTLAEMLPT